MCRHRVQFYESDAFLARKVLGFLTPGVREGGSAVVIATALHLTRLKAMLGNEDLGRGERSRVVWLDANETLDRFMVGSFPDPERFQSVVGELLRRAGNLGNGQVSAFGEMVAVLYLRGNPEAAARLEALWETLFQEHSFALLCAYPMSAFSAEHHALAFRAICDAHTGVAPLEHVEHVADDNEQLHRVIAQLQQQADAAVAARTRDANESVDPVTRAQRRLFANQQASRAAAARAYDDAHDASVAAASEAGFLTHGISSAGPFLTLEAAALKLKLSRPHVLKLVAEQRFSDVVRLAGLMPLIPLQEVNRVARELGVPESG